MKPDLTKFSETVFIERPLCTPLITQLNATAWLLNVETTIVLRPLIQLICLQV